MSERATGRLAWSIAAAALALVAASLVLGYWNGDLTNLANNYWPDHFVDLGIAIAGAVVASRRRSNVIGWILLGTSLVGALRVAAAEYAIHGLATGHPALGTTWAAWVASWALTFVFPAGGVLFLLLLFPNGRLLSHRWKVVAWLAAAWCAVELALTWLTPSPISLRSGLPTVPNPTGVRGFPDSDNGLLGAFWVLGLLLLLCAAASLILRYRRAAGDERHQLKWLALSAGVLVAALVGTVLPAGTGTLGSAVFNAVVVAGFGVAVPASIGVAILRYRLYDIDLVINRTLLYGALAAFITAVYVAIVVGIGRAFGSGSRPNLALSILATAVVAVAFQPVREQLQRVANRLVYGKRASPYEVIADFSRRAAGALSVDDVLPRMTETAARGVGARLARVRLLLHDGSKRETVWPQEGETEARDRTVWSRALEVTHEGDRVGEIAVAKARGEQLVPAEERLLSDLAAQAGLAFHNVRLTFELQARLAEISHQAAELRASSQRIVTAQEAERQRLQDTLRAGVQRKLSEIADELEEVESRVLDDPVEAGRSLDELTTRTLATLEELRDIARGIFPPLLADTGLVAALEAHVRRIGLDIQIVADERVTPERFPQQVEAAVYFCSLEALRQVTSDGTSSGGEIQLRAAGGWLEFSVPLGHRSGGSTASDLDDGLEGMRDRVEALGGSLDLRATPEGPTVVGRVPAGEPDAAEGMEPVG